MPVAYYPADDSPPRRSVGDWEFSYALDGRAVVDLWRVPARTVAVDDPNREVGLCVRIWDPRLQLWRFAFHSTVSSTVIHMYGRQVGDEIVLERAEGDSIERWVFHAIERDTFSWRSELSRNGGPWRQVQVLHARRVRTSGASLVQTLVAADPHPSIAQAAHTFDRFTGAWDCDYAHFDRAGTTLERYSGEVVFGWVLDGRAVQDVCIGYPVEPDGERSLGTTVRFFGPAAGLWTAVWIAPQGGVVRILTGGPTEDGRIVLHGQNNDGCRYRWIFDDIEQDSFSWQGERQDSPDDMWWTNARYRMTRRLGSSSGQQPDS